MGFTTETVMGRTTTSVTLTTEASVEIRLLNYRLIQLKVCKGLFTDPVLR